MRLLHVEDEDRVVVLGQMLVRLKLGIRIRVQGDDACEVNALSSLFCG